jgi:hypothetical protein
VISCSGWDSEKIREKKDDIAGPGERAAKVQGLPVKASENSLKKASGACDPLFWGSHPEQSTQERAQVKASRRNLVSKIPSESSDRKIWRGSVESPGNPPFWRALAQNF